MIAKLLTFSSDPAKYSYEIPNILDRTNAKLYIHLITEDATIYNQLSNLGIPEIHQATARICDEAMVLTKEWNRYFARWSTIEKIKKKPDDFTTETQSLITKIKKKITVEESLLFPLAEKYL
jgi:hypothetical protein